MEKETELWAGVSGEVLTSGKLLCGALISFPFLW